MKIISRLLGVRGSLERDLERVRDAQDESGVKLAEALLAQQRAERRLAVVEARVGIARRRQ